MILEDKIDQLADNPAVKALCLARLMSITAEERKHLFDETLGQRTGKFEQEEHLLSYEYQSLFENLSAEQKVPLLALAGDVFHSHVSTAGSFLVFLDQVVVPAVEEVKNLRTTVENLTKAVEVK